jgi:hypothetical protein
MKVGKNDLVYEPGDISNKPYNFFLPFLVSLNSKSPDKNVTIRHEIIPSAA